MVQVMKGNLKRIIIMMVNLNLKMEDIIQGNG